MRALRLGVLLWMAAGCASGPHPTDASRAEKEGPGTERALPIPADLAPRIQESIDVGRLLYFLDKASAIGTDVLREKVPDFRSRGLGGWITLQNGDETGKSLDSFSVLFMTREEPLRLVFTVNVPLRGQPTLKEASPPTLVEEFGIRIYRARKTALEAAPPGDRPFNPVILPGDSVGRPDAFLVYLLAAEQRAGEMVFGIHYRALISGDGSSVKQLVPLSKSAFVLPPPAQNLPPGAVPVASFVTQIVTDWPSEIHVFVSLLHNRAPLYVVTKRGIWLVIGDKITLVDDKPPR